MLKNIFKEKKTSIIAAITSVVVILGAFGIFSSEQQTAITENVDAVMIGIGAIVAIVTAFLAKDPDSKN